MHRRFTRFLLLAVAPLLLAASSDNKPILGFENDHATQQLALESKFDATLDPALHREWMQRLTAHPHHIGSPHQKENVEFIAQQFRSWGYDTQIEEFHVLFPTPKTRLLEMIAPEHFVASLQEKPLPEDKTSSLLGEMLPPFNAYSADGDVTAPLVYVNYGLPRDYEELERRGIDVKGKIVIARYGASWRGIKPKVAAEHGAIGCIIYSDPHDDGFFQGDIYPKGSFRNDSGAQRGSVMDMPVYPGDPLTPGVGATNDAKRLAIKDARTITKIPVLPISYGDALPLLRALGGPVAPEGWRGALPITYHIGAGPSTVHLKLEFNWNLVPEYDVIAKMKGSERPDEWIIRGNHSDAWVFGADDPISGLVALMDEARGVAQLAKSGWKPKRTIVYAAWDGEEPSLLGSTEWAEAHADELKTKGAVYINSDSNGRGFFYAEGSHTLEHFVNQVERDVVDPEKNVSVGERRRAQAIVDVSQKERDDIRNRADLRIDALGAGSDYSGFLQHLGVASLNIGYGGENVGSQYHSMFDSFDYYTRFGDPTFEYGVALAKTGGRMVLRLADADVLPFEFNDLADTIAMYVKEVNQLTDSMRTETAEKNQQNSDGTSARTDDPKDTLVVPAMKDPVPHLNFAPLENASDRLTEAAKRFETARAARTTPLSNDQQKALDALFIDIERMLTKSDGLPGRPWYRHYVYAPGQYTGYGVKTLPSVREAIEQRQWKDANEQIIVVANLLDNYSASLDRATTLVKK